MKEKLINFLKEHSIFEEWDIERIANSILENEIDENTTSWELSAKYSIDNHPHILRF
jgi:hypothetical protein